MSRSLKLIGLAALFVPFCIPGRGQPAGPAFVKPSDAELRKRLSPEQYEVTQKAGTERPHRNAYWDNHAPGIYVDIVSGEALFSSQDKYESGTGWPSFTRPLVPENLVEKEDRGFFSVRTEIRSRKADSHIGHVFDDGPAPTGKRYCMNSAALRFIPADKLAAEGYGAFAAAFAMEKKGGAPGTNASTGNASATPPPGAGVAGVPSVDAGNGLRRAFFAGGCFWCVEAAFEKVEGVREVISGFTGGGKANPTYEEVSSGATGHVESVEVIYDPKKVSYAQLVEAHWRNIDPTDAGGQFVDRGAQYRPVLWVIDAEQRRVAEAAKAELSARKLYKNPVNIEILQAGPFYRAEAYHQDYYKENPIRYKYYRFRSGRDQFLEPIWGAKGK